MISTNFVPTFKERASSNMCYNHGLKLRSGDVTSAFLQTDRDMSDEELYVWAPSELAMLYGADPSKPVMPLKEGILWIVTCAKEKEVV